jgi:predicted N-acetyltransferase YhbS
MCVPLKVEENYNGGGIAESLLNAGVQASAKVTVE